MCIGSVITAIENMMIKILIAESNCLNGTRDNGGMANVKDKDQQTIVYLVELQDDLVDLDDLVLYRDVIGFN